MTAETIEPAAADAAAAPLDLLLTDAALGVLNRVVPDGSGLRLAVALAARPRLVADRTRNLLGELARIAAGTSQVQPSGGAAGSPTRAGPATRCCAARCRPTWPPRRRPRA
jgi:polyhydroxyalkanoate synthase